MPHPLRSPRRRVLAAATALATGLIALGAALTAAGAADAATTLGASAAATGRYFGAAVTNTWNAQAGASGGAVTFGNVGYNGAVAAGASTEFGFQGTGTGPSGMPSGTAR